MKHMLVAIGVLGLVCLAVPAQTEEAKPGPEVKKLDMLLGHWAGQEKGSTPEGAEYEIEWSGKTQRMGDFFYVWRGAWKDADGNQGEGMRITGYDPIKKAYFIRLFNSNGLRGTATATLGDKTFKEDWAFFTPAGGETRVRCSETFSEAEFTYECERHTDGKWVSAQTGKATKVK